MQGPTRSLPYPARNASGSGEQERQLARLLRLYAGMERGGGRTVLVTGLGVRADASLLEAFAEKVRAAGGLFLRAGCPPPGGQNPGAPLRQILAGAPRLAALAERVGPVTAEECPALAREVWAAMLELARVQPLVLALSDVDRADQLTLDALLHLQRRIADSRVLVVLVSRDRLRPLDPRFRAQLAMLGPVTGIRSAAPSRPRATARTKELVHLLRYQLWYGRDEAVETIRLLARTTGSGPAAAGGSSIAVQYRAVLDWARLNDPAVLARADPDLLAQPLGSPLGEVVEGRDGAVASAEAALRAFRGGEPAPEAALLALLALVHADRPDRASAWCDTFAEDAEPQRSQTWRARIAQMRAHVALHQGELDVAERQARRALEAMSPRQWGVAIASPLASLLLATAALGAVDDAEFHLRILSPAAAEHALRRPDFLRARGHVHLAAGRLHLAHDDFGAAGELARRWNLDFPVLLPWRGDLAEVHLRRGDPDGAAELLRAQLARPSAERRRARGVTLRLLAETVDARRRPVVLREAVDLLRASGDRHELALASAPVPARAARRRPGGGASPVPQASPSPPSSAPGSGGAAGGAARGAAGGAARGAARGGAGGGAARGRVPAPSGPEEALSRLTDAERKVAALAASGRTNRQISQELFVTVSTVEQHLTRIFRKLDVRRRTDLPLSTLSKDDGIKREVPIDPI